MQELGNINLKINFNRFEKYRSFNIDYKLICTDSFQFSSSILESLDKSLHKNDSLYLSQEFYSQVLYLVEPKIFLSL